MIDGVGVGVRVAEDEAAAEREGGAEGVGAMVVVLDAAEEAEGDVDSVGTQLTPTVKLSGDVGGKVTADSGARSAPRRVRTAPLILLANTVPKKSSLRL